MCIAIRYQSNKGLEATHFPSAMARLPVLNRHHAVRFIPWGRRAHQAGNLPLGGWAALQSIHDHAWDAYFPRAVRIPAVGFMEKNIEERRAWFEVTQGLCIQGLLARYDKECRLYVVTITPQACDNDFLRWPRLIALHD